MCFRPGALVTLGRYHLGLFAQFLHQPLPSLNIELNLFLRFGTGKEIKVDRYQEFIIICTEMLGQSQARVGSRACALVSLKSMDTSPGAPGKQVECAGADGQRD